MDSLFVIFCKYILFLLILTIMCILCLNFSRTDPPLVRSSTPNTLSVQVPCTGSGTVGTTVNSSHSMPNVSDGQTTSNGSICKKSVDPTCERLRAGSSIHGIAVSKEDVSVSKYEMEQASRALCFRTPPKG